MSNTKLFEDFKKSSAIDWKNQIIKELKEKPFESLITKTPEGISIKPFYHQDTAGHAAINVQNSTQKVNEALPPRYWANQAKVEVKNENEANQSALNALNGGAEGIIFVIDKADVNLETLLNEIQPEYCMISFESKRPFYSLISQYLNYISAHEFDNRKINGFYHCDSIECRDNGTTSLTNDDYESIAELIKAADDYPDFKALCISSNLFHNAGANITHELGLLLSKSVELFDKLTDLDLEFSRIIKSTVFSLAVGSNYFFEIAKLKAIKYNLLKVAEAYNSNVNPDDIFIHCNTSFRSKSALDFNVNLLRVTNEAMASVLGGCNSLWVQPHDESAGKPTSKTFKRIALNISNILKEEAHLDKVVDPTKGSYYIENLINEISTSSWNIFIELEKDGAYNHHYGSGNVHQIIEADAGKAEQNLWARKDLMIGANTYQLIGEKIGDSLDTKESGNSLEAKRLTSSIELMRYRVEKLVGEKGEKARPMAQIILLGTDPVSKAKSDFAYSFLGIAGIGISSEKFIKKLDEGSTSDENAVITVLCYAETPENIEEYIAKHKGILLIAGQEPNEADLQKTGLYGCINRKVDAKRFLDRLLKDLGIELS